MGLLVEFDVINDFGFLDETEEYGIMPDYSEGCKVFVEVFLKVARELVPVDTGYLKHTLEAECDDTSCKAETDCEYAQYPEFGTWCQSAQPYFTPAIEAGLLAAEPFWKEAEEQAIMEEEFLIAEEELEERANSYAKQQGKSRGTRDYFRSRGKGPEQFGGINFSSPAALLGSIIGAFIVAAIVTTVQAMFGKDFTYIGRDIHDRVLGGKKGSIYMPEVVIT